MIDEKRLRWLLDLLVEKKILHAGQRQDVTNRGKDRARHILLDKRAELRKLLGKQRVAYQVSEIELVASFRFRQDETEHKTLVDERLVTKRGQGHAFGHPRLPGFHVGADGIRHVDCTLLANAVDLDNEGGLALKM